MDCMADTVLFLEDDPVRIAAMNGILQSLSLNALFVDRVNAFEAAYLRHQSEVCLICLDHDLPSIQTDNGLVDPGDGRDACEFLAGHVPTCPVIVHSSNYAAVPVMLEMLRRAGWPATFVTPHSATPVGWVFEEWQAELKNRLNLTA